MASRKKTMDLKLTKKKFKAKSQKVKLFRSNDPLYSVFMWGLNHTVSASTISVYSLTIIVHQEYLP